MENVKFCSWEGRPAIWRPGKALAFVRGEWRQVDDADVAMSAKVVTKVVFEMLFPIVPKAPIGALSAPE